jgi:hypothetical protein
MSEPLARRVSAPFRLTVTSPPKEEVPKETSKTLEQSVQDIENQRWLKVGVSKLGMDATFVLKRRSRLHVEGETLRGRVVNCTYRPYNYPDGRYYGIQLPDEQSLVYPLVSDITEWHTDNIPIKPLQERA